MAGATLPTTRGNVRGGSREARDGNACHDVPTAPAAGDLGGLFPAATRPSGDSDNDLNAAVANGVGGRAWWWWWWWWGERGGEYDST